MPVRNEPYYPTVQLLIDALADWIKYRRDLAEVSRIGRTQFDQIARDLRIAPDQLDQLISLGPHASDELPRMLEALGIDEADLARSHPLLLRDMERVCAMCGHKRECDHDLADGIAAEHYASYCPNVANIEALKQERASQGISNP